MPEPLVVFMEGGSEVFENFGQFGEILTPDRSRGFLQLLGWRRGSESNRRIKVLQTSPLPLGYRALPIN